MLSELPSQTPTAESGGTTMGKLVRGSVCPAWILTRPLLYCSDQPVKWVKEFDPTALNGKFSMDCEYWWSSEYRRSSSAVT